MQTCLVRNTEWKEIVKTLARIIPKGEYIKIFCMKLHRYEGKQFSKATHALIF